MSESGMYQNPCGVLGALQLPLDQGGWDEVILLGQNNQRAGREVMWPEHQFGPVELAAERLRDRQVSTARKADEIQGAKDGGEAGPIRLPIDKVVQELRVAHQHAYRIKDHQRVHSLLL